MIKIHSKIFSFTISILYFSLFWSLSSSFLISKLVHHYSYNLCIIQILSLSSLYENICIYICTLYIILFVNIFQRSKVQGSQSCKYLTICIISMYLNTKKLYCTSLISGIPFFFCVHNFTVRYTTSHCSKCYEHKI